MRISLEPHEWDRVKHLLVRAGVEDVDQVDPEAWLQEHLMELLDKVEAYIDHPLVRALLTMLK